MSTVYKWCIFILFVAFLNMAFLTLAAWIYCRIETPEQSGEDSSACKNATSTNSDSYTFSDCFFFCFTTVSTIGYGNISPRTTWGKIFSIVLSVIGIPMFLIMLMHVAGYLTCFLYYLIMKLIFALTHIQCAKVKTVPSRCAETPYWFMTCMFASCVIVGTYLAKVLTEDWTLFDAFYFNIISLTTVGYGDIIPCYEDNYLAPTLPFLTFGLSVTSAFIQKTSDIFNDFWKNFLTEMDQKVHHRRSNQDLNVMEVKGHEENASQLKVVYRDQSIPLDSILREFGYNRLGHSELAVEVAISNLDDILKTCMDKTSD